MLWSWKCHAKGDRLERIRAFTCSLLSWQFDSSRSGFGRFSRNFRGILCPQRSFSCFDIPEHYSDDLWCNRRVSHRKIHPSRTSRCISQNYLSVQILRLVRDGIKLYFLIASLLAFSLGLTTGFLLTPHPEEDPRMTKVISLGAIRGVFLWLEVSPMGYPQVGQSWNIFVYEAEASSGARHLRPSLSNTIVSVQLKSGDRRQVYYLPVDEKGQTSFQYLPEYSDIAFQASRGELSSQKIIISKHYVSSEVVNNLSAFNVFMSIASVVVGGLTFRYGKLGKLVKAICLLTLSLFAFVTLFSLYVKYFNETTWGYPESIVNGIVTLTLLKYASYIGVVLLVISSVARVMIELRSPKREVKENGDKGS